MWFKFWEEAIGPLPDLWNRLGRGADWRSALDGAVRGPGLVDLGDAFTLHAVWNAFACANDDGRHYAPEAAGCPEASLSAVDVTDVPADGVIEVDLEGAYVAEYHATVVGSGNQLAVSCTAGDDNGELGVAVVDVSSGEATFARVEAAGALRLDGPSSTVDRAALVVLTGLDESGAEARCTVFEVEEPPRRSGGMQACSTSASSAAWAWLLLVPLVWRRRR